MAVEFEALRDEILARMHEWAPVHSTFLGIHDYDGELGDVSGVAIASQARAMSSYADRLDGLGGLAPDAEDERVLLLHLLRSELLDVETLREWSRNPSHYPTLCLYGLYILVARDFAPLPERARDFLSRLRQVPAVLAAARENVAEPPAVFCITARLHAQGGLAFLAETVPQLAGLVPDLAAGLAEAAEAAADAMHGFDAYLARLLEEDRGAPFAIGEPAFAQKMWLDHMIRTTPAELLVLGEEQVALATGKLAELAGRIEPGADWTDVVARLKDDHPSPGTLLAEYRAAMAAARDFVAERELATIPPNEHLDVIETPLFDRATIPYAAYLPPAPFEDGKVGLFYVTPVEDGAQDAEERLRGHCRAGLPITALHEGYPGHHLQLSVAGHQGGPVARHWQDTVTAEGWALYCELMMTEEGFLGAPESQLLMYKDALWRAVRVIVDVGLHCGGMSVGEAVDALVDRAHLERPNAEAEVRRYTMSPTQPLSYTVGKLGLLALRDECRAAEGDAFSLKAFHDRVLSCGTVPQAMIRRKLTGG